MRRLAFSIAAVVFLAAGPAAAATITEPSGSVTATADLGPVTVRATGFSDGATVYVEQCDGADPAGPQWTVGLHCDVGTAPAAVVASGGTALFAAADLNHRFRPFAGEGPSS